MLQGEAAYRRKPYAKNTTNVTPEYSAAYILKVFKILKNVAEIGV
jgi:hypothetical protein